MVNLFTAFSKCGREMTMSSQFHIHIYNDNINVRIY